MKVRWTYLDPGGSAVVFDHAANLTEFSTDRDQQLNPRTGNYMFETRTISMKVRLLANGQDAIRSAAIALEAAYSYPGLSWEFLHDDDSRSAHSMLTPNLLGYISAKVAWPNSLNNEYATQRGCQLTLTARYVREPGAYVSYRESFVLIGNGYPRRRVVESVIGPPIKQTLCNYTMYRAIQSGEAIGTTFRPSAPDPYLPAPWYDGDQSSVEKFSGERHLLTQIFPGIRWTYAFSSPTVIPFYNPGF